MTMNDQMKIKGAWAMGLLLGLAAPAMAQTGPESETTAPAVTVTASPLATGSSTGSVLGSGSSVPQIGGMVAGGLTLNAALQESVSQSPVYRQAQDMERQASWGQVKAFSDGFLPHVSVSGQHFFDIQYPYLSIEFAGPPALTFPSIQPDTELSLDASFDVFDGFKNVHELDSANNSHEAAKIMADWSLFQLQQKIRLMFYEAIAAQELSDMADQNVKTLQDHLRIVTDQLDNGQATKYDSLRVKVQLDESQSDQISAHDQVVLARENLAQIMGMKTDDRPLSGILPVLDAAKILGAAGDLDFNQRPDLKAAELQAKAAEDESAASEASFLIPKVSVIGQYQWYDTPNYYGTVIHTDEFRDDYYIGASATWDIFDGASALAKANEDGEKAKGARDSFEAVQVEAPYNFDLWKRRLVSNVAIYNAKLTDVAEAKESARLATVGFQAGTRTTTDVLDAELEEYRAAAGLVQAQIDSFEALINLELSVGKRIENE
jgi:outer membrane protein TolC